MRRHRSRHPRVRSQPPSVFHGNLSDLLGRASCIATGPVPCPFLEAGRYNDTEALGQVTDCTAESLGEVRRQIAFATRAFQETPSEGKDGEEVRERVNER